MWDQVDHRSGLGEVRDVKAHIAGLKVPPEGRQSVLAGLRITPLPQVLGQFEASAKGALESNCSFKLNIIGYRQVVG